MKFSEFIPLTCRTFNYQTPKLDFQHCILGLIDEKGELASAIKKKIGYGKIIDITNVKEEIGDLSWFLAQLTHLNKIEEPNKSMLYADLDKATMAKRQKSNYSMFSDIVYIDRFTTAIAAMYEGQPRDINFILQYGDLLLKLIDILATIAVKCGTTYSAILDANIKKLEARFPDKFDSELVEEVNRDRRKEAHIISKNTK